MCWSRDNGPGPDGGCRIPSVSEHEQLQSVGLQGPTLQALTMPAPVSMIADDLFINLFFS